MLFYFLLLSIFSYISRNKQNGNELAIVKHIRSSSYHYKTCICSYLKFYEQILFFEKETRSVQLSIYIGKNMINNAYTLTQCWSRFPLRWGCRWRSRLVCHRWRQWRCTVWRWCPQPHSLTLTPAWLVCWWSLGPSSHL